MTSPQQYCYFPLFVSSADKCHPHKVPCRMWPIFVETKPPKSQDLHIISVLLKSTCGYMECPNPEATKAQRFTVSPAPRLWYWWAFCYTKLQSHIGIQDRSTLQVVVGSLEDVNSCWSFAGITHCCAALTVSPLTPQLFFTKPGKTVVATPVKFLSFPCGFQLGLNNTGMFERYEEKSFGLVDLNNMMQLLTFLNILSLRLKTVQKLIFQAPHMNRSNSCQNVVIHINFWVSARQ